ncbi:MAG: hypothetical protein AAF559_12895 [Pseudomonadota bacterium]
MWVLVFIALQAGLVLGLRAVGLDLLWSAMAPLGLVALYWGAGLVWIASPACGDPNICDSGGMLAHSANSAAVAFLAGLISLCTAVGYQVAQRRKASETDDPSA